ncbi:hypothetical protein FKM82_027281 [Ascaphus truei]
MGNRRSSSRAPPAGLLRYQAQIAGISIGLHGAVMATYEETARWSLQRREKEQRAINTKLTLTLPLPPGSQCMWLLHSIVP